MQDVLRKITHSVYTICTPLHIQDDTHYNYNYLNIDKGDMGICLYSYLMSTNHMWNCVYECQVPRE